LAEPSTRGIGVADNCRMITEGNGRCAGSADRSRFRGIARGSDPEWNHAKGLLVRVVEMLSKMS